MFDYLAMAYKDSEYTIMIDRCRALTQTYIFKVVISPAGSREIVWVS